MKLLNQTYKIVRDNRFSGIVITDYDYETKKTIMRYNSYRLGRKPEFYIIGTVFHEIRHIIQGDLPYETEKEQIFCELDAEQYAVEMFSQFYPKEGKEYIRFVKEEELENKRWQKRSPIHFKAYSQIPEYK